VEGRVAPVREGRCWDRGVLLRAFCALSATEEKKPDTDMLLVRAKRGKTERKGKGFLLNTASCASSGPISLTS